MADEEESVNGGGRRRCRRRGRRCKRSLEETATREGLLMVRGRRKRCLGLFARISAFWGHIIIFKRLHKTSLILINL